MWQQRNLLWKCDEFSYLVAYIRLSTHVANMHPYEMTDEITPENTYMLMRLKCTHLSFVISWVAYQAPVVARNILAILDSFLQEDLQCCRNAELMQVVPWETLKHPDEWQSEKRHSGKMILVQVYGHEDPKRATTQPTWSSIAEHSRTQCSNGRHKNRLEKAEGTV